MSASSRLASSFLVTRIVAALLGISTISILTPVISAASAQEWYAPSPYERLTPGHQNDTINILSAAVNRVSSESEGDIVALAAVPRLRRQSVAVAERTGVANCRGDCVAEGYLMMTIRHIQVANDSAVVHLNTKRLYPRASRGVLFNAFIVHLQRNAAAEFGWRVTNVQVSEG